MLALSCVAHAWRQGQRSSDRLRNLLFDREYVGNAAIVGLRPQRATVRNFGQTKVDTQLLAALTQADLERMGDVQALAQIVQIAFFRLRAQRRGLRNQAQSIDPRQPGGQLLA